MSTSQILETLSHGLESAPDDPSTVVALYVYLAALSLTDPKDQDTWRNIEKLDLSRLEWGDVMRTLSRLQAIPTNSMEVTLPTLP
jgi:hypothetical protein